MRDQKSRRGWAIAVCALLVLGAGTLPALSQEWVTGTDGVTPVLKTPAILGTDAPDLRGGGARGPAWGTQDGTDYWIPAAAFTPRASNTWLYDGAGYIHPTSVTGNAFWWAPLNLPNGVLLVGLRLYFYDADAVNDMNIYLTSYEGDSGVTDLFNTSTSGSSGYGNLFLDTNNTIDLRDDVTGEGRLYVVNLRFNDTSGMIRLKGVRAFYTLQVSPAPVAATFGDVPTGHAFFQFVEALANSGITAGCGGGNFCPDAPLTRGQMAVFLAKALGLHWPF